MISAGTAGLVTMIHTAEIKNDINTIDNRLGDVYPEDVRNEMRDMMVRVDSDHTNDLNYDKEILFRTDKILKLLMAYTEVTETE